MADEKVSNEVAVAVQAFREAEHAEFRLEEKLRKLSAATMLVGRVGKTKDKTDYFNLTEEVRAEYAAKREKRGY